MFDYFRVLVALILAISLSACVITSDRALFDSSGAQRFLPNNTFAVGSSEMYALQWGSSDYKFVDNESFHSVRFFPLREVAADAYAAEIYNQGGGYTYVLLLSRQDGIFRVTAIEQVLINAGVDYQSDAEAGIKVETREALIDAFRALYREYQGKPDQLAAYRIFDWDDPAQRDVVVNLLAEAQAEKEARSQASASQPSGNQASASQPAVTEAGQWAYREEKDPIDDTLRQYIFGFPSEYSGTQAEPFIRIGCYPSGMGITLYWGAVLADLYPSGSVSMAGVDVRFGSSPAQFTGWAVSQDWASTYPPNQLAGAGAQLGDALIGSLLPGYKQANSTWTAASFHRNMLSTDRLVMRASTRGAGSATLTFDMAGYAQVAQNFRQSCR